MTDNNTAATLESALSIAMSRAPGHDTPDGGKVVFVPEGYRTHKIDPLDKPLTRVVQSVSMHDRDSFIAYVNRFKADETRIFAEPGFIAGGQAGVMAVLDYHAAHDKADYGVHTANYSPRYSDQWKRWRAACAPMKQAEFAEFIEEVRADIVDPDAARLMDIVRTFKASKKLDFDSVVYQQNGDVKLVYDEKTEQKGSSGPLPELMKIGIPVYFRGAAYSVPIFIRYRVGNGGVQFSLKMDRADVIEDAAFGELTKAISEATAIDVYLGRR